MPFLLQRKEVLTGNLHRHRGSMMRAVRPPGPGWLQPVQMCHTEVPKTGVTSPGWDRRTRRALTAGKEFSDRHCYKHEGWEAGSVMISNQTIWRPEKASWWRQGSRDQGSTREERQDIVTFCFGDLPSISLSSNHGQNMSPLSKPDHW